MKNKLGITIEKFRGELPTSDDSPKPNNRRDSPAPRIVVCPPMEESVLTPPPVARGARLFRAISRRISRRRADEDESGSSSGSDSAVSCERELHRARDTDRSSCSVSDSSEGSEPTRRHRSTISFRKVFQSLTISPRSRSSAATERPRQPKKNAQPKRILRPPVTYTYVRGLSGLPTQRIPRPRQQTSGLNR